jgi:uncharacterized protein YegL
MLVKDKEYVADVKEKAKAEEIYNEESSAGNNVGIVQQDAREANLIKVLVNVEPRGKVRFRITYEQLLERRLGKYEHTVHVNPGQVVKDLKIEVFINESLPLTSVTVPELKTDSNAITSSKSNPLTSIEYIEDNKAHIVYSPDVAEQLKQSKEGIRGQFIVQYDVERKNEVGGEIQVLDGYFVHFFSPDKLETLPKHVIFILDVSGSMSGEKLQQTKDAMVTIFDELTEKDYFTVFTFSSGVTEWVQGQEINDDSKYNIQYDEPQSEESQKSHPYQGTKELKREALKYVLGLNAGGGTNINSAVLAGVRFAMMAAKAESYSSRHNTKPMIILMTDGQGSTSKEQIKKNVAEANNEIDIPIYGLAFGNGADFDLIKTLAVDNNAFARKIFEGSDAAIQLEKFYLQIASPKLSNVKIDYVGEGLASDSVTKSKEVTYNGGNEIVVSGKIDPEQLENLVITIAGEGISGPYIKKLRICQPKVLNIPTLDEAFSCLPIPSPQPPKSEAENFIEKLWAFKTIKQLEAVEDKGEDDKQKMLDISLKYNFVTSLTSLIVTKPGASADEVAEDIVEPVPVSTDRQNFNKGGVQLTAFSGSAFALVTPHRPIISKFIGGNSAKRRPQFSPPRPASRPPQLIPVIAEADESYDSDSSSGENSSSVESLTSTRPPTTSRPPRTSTFRPSTTTTTTTTSATEQPQSCTGLASISLYDKTYARGENLTLTEDISDFSQSEIDFDDLLTSLEVRGECCWDVYIDVGFGGDRMRFAPGAVENRVQGNVFREASSISKVQC